MSPESSVMALAICAVLGFSKLHLSTVCSIVSSCGLGAGAAWGTAPAPRSALNASVSVAALVSDLALVSPAERHAIHNCNGRNMGCQTHTSPDSGQDLVPDLLSS